MSRPANALRWPHGALALRRCQLVLAGAGMMALACAALLTLLIATPARADVFGPISLVSYGEVDGSELLQQAEYAHDDAVSADGRYVAFDGSVGGVTGVWRRELATDVIEEVAGGDAAMPSISEDGSYVSFTTNEGASLPEITDLRPDAQPRPEAVSVYRRDMNNHPAATAGEEVARAPAERAFLIASTPVGSGEPLRYAAPSGETTREGAYAVGRTAMSADGSRVAFVTTAVSDLVSYPAQEEAERARGETPAPHTPAAQVAVHDFETGATELVSRCRFGCGQGAAAGAAEPVVTSEDESTTTGAAAVLGNVFPAHAAGGQSPGASLSADGSTVAWIGQNLAQQAPTLPQEELEPTYAEPLWERLPAAGNQARRVTGGSDPESPACVAKGETTLPEESEDAADPCQGPFEREPSSPLSNGFFKANQKFDLTPRLSKDGDEVAFVAEARLVTQGSDFGSFTNGHPLDVYVSNMSPELTRTQALTPVTEAGPGGTAASAAVTDFEISPDGKQVAFSTARTEFFLGTPTLISPPAGEPRIAELFDADLADGTLTRITHGYSSESEPSEQPHTTRSQGGNPYAAGTIGPEEVDRLGALSPAFAADGNELVFTSTAANLVYGDGNSPPEPVLCCVAGDGSDVFAIDRRQFSTEAPPQSLSPAPAVAVAPAWRLGATAVSRRDGSVLLYVQAPGPGTVRAGAQGWVVVEPAQPARTARRGRSSRHASDSRRTVAARTVATRSAQVHGVGLTTLTLALAPPYAAFARWRGGFSATVTVTFAAPGHGPLRDSLMVTFVDKAKRSNGRSSKRHGRSSKAVIRP
jgi:hypothetical protein